MIASSALIAYFEKALADEWGYILGASGVVCTQGLIDYSANRWPDNTATLKYGKKWLGRMVNDCSGMFYDAFKKAGLSIPHGSNSIWNGGHLSKKGEITPGISLRPGTAVFLRRPDKTKPGGWDYHHIGLYVGAGRVIEAKGTQWGVVESRLSDWDTWGELKKVKYESLEVVIMPVVGKAKVKTSGGILNLRDGPNGRDIGDIPNGADVDILEKTSDAWWKVTHNGNVGWVAVQYLVEQASTVGTVAVVLSRETWEAVRAAIAAALG